MNCVICGNTVLNEPENTILEHPLCNTCYLINNIKVGSIVRWNCSKPEYRVPEFIVLEIYLKEDSMDKDTLIYIKTHDGLEAEVHLYELTILGECDSSTLKAEIERKEFFNRPNKIL